VKKRNAIAALVVSMFIVASMSGTAIADDVCTWINVNTSSYDQPYGFYELNDIAIDTSGNIYTIEGIPDRITVINPEGKVIKEIPVLALALDEVGNIYVVDSDNNRVQVFSSDYTFLTEITLPNRNSSFSSVAIDHKGAIYVSDYGNLYKGVSNYLGWMLSTQTRLLPSVLMP
jgi:DNA-binding beta-propeller fold protein YncE